MQISVSPAQAELQHYVLLYGVLLLTAVVARAAVCLFVQAKQAAPNARPLGRYEVAKVMGGSLQVVQTALAGLVDAGAVALAPGADTEFRSRPQAQPPLDAVQRQVRALLPTHPNGFRLTWAFRRSDIAAQLRRGLSVSGFMIPRRRPYSILVALVRAYFWLILLAVCVVGLLSGLDLFLVMFGTAHVFVALACHAWLPLTLTWRGNRLRRDIRNVLRKHNGAGVQASSAMQLEQTGAALSALGAKWHFAPGWSETPNGLVAIAGWPAYRNGWGQYREPQKYWSLGSWPFSRTSGSRRKIGLLYQATGLVCGLAAIVSAPFLFQDPQYLVLKLLLVLIILPGMGARMVTLGRKHRVASGAESTPGETTHGTDSDDSRHTAPRPRVLYLRSFTNDAGLEEGRQHLQTALGFRSSYIEQLVHVLRPFGDLVAIGNPGAALPGLGPAQLFVSPDTGAGASQGARDEWQAEVLRLLDCASLVVLAAGLGKGLLWEFQQATARVPPRNLLVFVPLGGADYALFRQHTGSYFPCGLPAYPRKPTGKSGPQYGLIYFEDDWTPRFVRFRLHPLVQLHLGRLAIRSSLNRVRNQIAHAMYPVFHQHQAPWPGLQIPVPFARGVRHRVLRGLSLTTLLVLLGVFWFLVWRFLWDFLRLYLLVSSV